jgi:hypothetical protein
VAYASEEIPVSGVLVVKEINGRIEYSLTFSPTPLLRLCGEKQSDLREVPVVRDQPPRLCKDMAWLVVAGIKFKDIDDDNIIQWKE